MKMELLQKKQNTRNVVLTGGNSGIGFQTIKALHQDGCNVIFGSRNQKRNEQAMNQIKEIPGGSIYCCSLDLSKRKSIEDFVKFVEEHYSTVDILINNAGLVVNEKSISELGIEMTYTINHFGHFYLTYLLLNKIKKSSQGRIINVSSMAHYLASDDLLDDLLCQKKYDAMNQYSNSKLLNVLFTVGLNNFFKQNNINNIKTASLHPGAVESNFGNQTFSVKCFKCFCCCLYVNNETGAQASLYLSRIQFEKIKSGQYYNDDTKHKEMDKRGRKIKLVEKLWEISEKAYGIKFNQ